MKLLFLSILTMLLCNNVFSQQRLVARTYSSRIMQSDSVRFLYAPGNNSNATYADYMAGKIKCDTQIQSIHDGAAYVNAMKRIDEYNPSGMLVRHTYQYPDSSIAGYPFVNAQKNEYIYAAGGELIREETYNNSAGWQLYVRTHHTYNTTGQLETSMYEVLNAGNWDTTGRYKYTYAGKNMIARTGQVLDTSSKWISKSEMGWSYDANVNNDTIIQRGFIDGISLDLSKEIFEYDARKLCVKYRHTEWDRYKNIWSIIRERHYIYDAVGRIIADTLFPQQGFQVPQPRQLTSYTYNALGLNDTFTYTIWDFDSSKYINVSRVVKEYNSELQPTEYRGEIWDANNSWTMAGDSEVHRFYYELIATGIQPMQALPVIGLYPNPANDFITLSITPTNNQPGIVSIYNTTGALLRQWEEKAGNTTRTIPLHGFENGNYILTLRSADGSKISRQFVVGH